MTPRNWLVAAVAASLLLLGTACSGNVDNNVVDSDSSAEARRELRWDVTQAIQATWTLEDQMDNLADRLGPLFPLDQRQAIEMRDQTAHLNDRLVAVSGRLAEIDRAVKAGDIDWAETQWADMINRGDTLLEQQPELLLGQIEALAEEYHIDPRLSHSVSEARQDLILVVNGLATLSGSPQGAG